MLILSSRVHLSLSSGLFPPGFLTKTLYAPHFSPIRATCSAHLIPLDFINRLKFYYKSWNPSLCYFAPSPHSPVTSSLLGPNILLSTLFSNTLCPRSSLNVTAQRSCSYKTRGKIVGQLTFAIHKVSFNP